MAQRSYLLGLIGEGVRPSLTPPMHEQEGAAQNLGFVYRPIDLTQLHLPASDVGRLLRNGMELGFDAFNITHPCKRTVLEYLDDVHPTAQRLGACNTVLLRNGKLVGYNTDRSGFASGLQFALPNADVQDIVLLGAGGAGAAVADALVGAGVSRLSIIDPEPQRAEELINQLHAAADNEQHLEIRIGTPDEAATWLANATGLVNASPVGMFSHPGMPIPHTALHAQLWVADIVYRPAETLLIQTARALGCAVMPGKAMAVGQAADTFELVTGLSPDRTRMREHLDALIDEEELQGRGIPVGLGTIPRAGPAEPRRFHDLEYLQSGVVLISGQPAADYPGSLHRRDRGHFDYGTRVITDRCGIRRGPGPLRRHHDFELDDWSAHATGWQRTIRYELRVAHPR